MKYFKFRFFIAILLLLNIFSFVEAKESENLSVEAQLKTRLRSANKLIPEANKMNDQALGIMEEGRLIAQNLTTSKGPQSYMSLLNEYERALSQYRSHRREYLKHCNKYHRSQEGPKVSSPYIPIGRLGKLKPLKLEVKDKCQKLMDIESRLLANEKKVMAMFENLVSSRNKEGQVEFASMWSGVYQQARENHQEAVDYSHEAMNKTSGASSKLHEMITAASRDGILSYQKQVFQKYQRHNALQSAINRRSNMHLGFALMIMSRLNSMRPRGVSAQGEMEGGFSQDQLQMETQKLAQEYAIVQNLYKKLQMAKQGK